MPEETNEDMITDSLVAYRLGRVEKAVDQTNRELIKLSELSQQISKNSWRLDSLESSRTRMYQFMTGISTAVIIIGLQMVLKLI